MDRDPENRIGAGSDDANAIVNHPFFAEMDWTALQEQRIPAPYTPETTTDKLDNTNGGLLDTDT